MAQPSEHFALLICNTTMISVGNDVDKLGHCINDALNIPNNISLRDSCGGGTSTKSKRSTILVHLAFHVHWIGDGKLMYVYKDK